MHCLHRDLRTDHNEQLVSIDTSSISISIIISIKYLQIPEQDASIQDISIDSSANFMAAINNKVLIIDVYS